MSHETQQPIDVLVAFRKERVEPMAFKVGGHYHHIKKINLIHSERHGRERKVYFSVSDEANAYRLSFATDTLKWQLEDIAML